MALRGSKACASPPPTAMPPAPCPRDARRAAPALQSPADAAATGPAGVRRSNHCRRQNAAHRRAGCPAVRTRPPAPAPYGRSAAARSGRHAPAPARNRGCPGGPPCRVCAGHAGRWRRSRSGPQARARNAAPAALSTCISVMTEEIFSVQSRSTWPPAPTCVAQMPSRATSDTDIRGVIAPRRAS